MEILPVEHEPFDRWGCTIPSGYSPSACFAWLRDVNGAITPAIYSFPKSAWMTAERNGLAQELPKRDQEQLSQLLAPNMRAAVRAAGTR